MAEEVLALRERLLFQTTCSVCLELFREPVLTACGHSFCQHCLAGVLGYPPRSAACPQCRDPVQPGSARPNRSLGDVADAVRSLGEVAAWPRCPQHGKPLALFCQAPCAALVCALCREGPEHRLHGVRPAEEAARELRETLQRNLLSLQEHKQYLNSRGDQKSDKLLTAVMWELQRLPETFEELQRCMEEQKKILLAQLEQMSQELVSKSDEYKSRVLERQSLLDTVIAQIKEKRDQPAVKFLMEVGRILRSCEAAKAPIPEPVSSELQRSVESLTWKSRQVADIADKFKVSLRNEMDRGKREQVTLDPETANLGLILSDDRKTVRFSGKYNPPDIPKRFTGNLSVLGSQGFTSGRHYWEVEVWNKGSWALGVALESVPRKELLNLLRSEKVWALQLDWRGQYRAERVSPYPLALGEAPQRIRLHLDYEAGQVTFYNAKDMTQILQFEATFTEKVFPYFWVCSKDTHIRVV
ncbi:E3 ubiquitin-protein ligase TRIM7-like [Vidua macroura]|uniref:E3 ubiquitin-protein ligase TRIM7-like n=1 Tax=Vidua macroura TaxID=187451 RepID=UPI0023A907D3|nr:E3 ubiquitin-protein ligase TRIM7-like [Vidua macroura]